MSIHKILKQITLATLLAASTVMAQTPYDEGQKALREQRWTDAAEQFERAMETDKKQVDAAMYWRAHALYKAGRKPEASRQVRSLESKYPDSRWVKEAQALQIEHHDSIDSSGFDDDLRIYALSQLMERDPQRALPLVLDMLKSTSSSSVRDGALFVLGMSDDPAAQKVIAEIVRHSNDPELQANAIHFLGAASTESSLALLDGLYTESADYLVKEAVIHAYIAGDDAAPLVRILRTEKNPDLQRDIIHSLGAMDATEELQAIYPTLENKGNKIAAIEAFAISGNVDMLRQVLKTETDTELRTGAIHAFAIADDDSSASFLISQYAQAPREEKTAIIESMMILDEVEGLINLLKRETDPELKREMLQMLTVMDTEASDEYLFELLEKKG